MPDSFRLRTLLTSIACAAGGMATAAHFRPVPTASVRPVSAGTLQADGPLVNRSARQARSDLEAFRAAGSPQARMDAALQLAEKGTEEDIRALLELSWKFPGDTSASLAAASLLKRWLTLNPEAAIEYARVHEGKLLSKLIGNWSVMEPEKAQSFVLSLPAGQERAQAWSEICRESLHGEAGKTWALLCRDPTNSGWGTQRIMEKLVSADPDDAIARLETLPPGMVVAARIAISKELMKTDPDQAWAWMGNQPKALALRGQALGVEFARDPAHAVVLLASLGPEEASNIINNYPYHLQSKDLPAVASALQSAAGLNAGQKRQLAGRIFSNAAWADPAGAVSLFSFFPENELPGQVNNLMRNWWRKDKAAAGEWLESLPQGPTRAAAETEGDRLETAKAEGPPMERNSPESVANSLKSGEYFGEDDARLSKITPEMLAEAFPPGKVDNSNMNFLQGLAAQNPATGAAWLQTQQLHGESAGNLLRQAAQFSSTWAAEDPAAAAAWVGQLPDGELANNAAANVALQYLRYAPAKATKWIESLPPGPARQAAEQRLGK